LELDEALVIKADRRILAWIGTRWRQISLLFPVSLSIQVHDLLNVMDANAISLRQLDRIFRCRSMVVGK
jgi:hypothetical protein